MKQQEDSEQWDEMGLEVRPAGSHPASSSCVTQADGTHLLSGIFLGIRWENVCRVHRTVADV